METVRVDSWQEEFVCAMCDQKTIISLGKRLNLKLHSDRYGSITKNYKALRSEREMLELEYLDLLTKCLTRRTPIQGN